MAALPEDPYKILGVTKEMSIADIRSAYRKLVLKCHPDKIQDDTLKAEKASEFQKVQEAYELLSNDAERQKYDDKVKLAELRKEMAKTNINSTPRSSAKYADFEPRSETRPSSYNSASSRDTPSVSKTYTYSKSWEDDIAHGSKIYEAGSRSARREGTKYADVRSSKRDSDREREKERDKDRESRDAKDSRESRESRDREKEKERDRDSDRDRERRKREKEEMARRAEKDAKRAEKKQKEKQRDKEIKREAEEKKKAKPYIEGFGGDDAHMPTPKSEKKKSSSSSKKFEEKQRDRSTHRDEPLPQPSVRSYPQVTRSEFSEPVRSQSMSEPAWSSMDKSNFAANYIRDARESQLKRSVTYHARNINIPAAPTPPPGPASAFAPPDDEEIHRSSARPRRGSAESARLSRDKPYRKQSSREPLAEEPVTLSGSPNSRSYHMSGSPPQMSRTNTMPADPSAYSRSMPPPSMNRAQTYNGYGDPMNPRGRDRSRMQPQIDEEDSDYAYEERGGRKHRGGRRTHSPEAYTDPRYPYEGRPGSYSRRAEAEPDAYFFSTSAGRASENRPSMPMREGSYSASAGAQHFSKVKTSKAYGYDDAQYTHHYPPRPREEHTAFA